MILQKRNLNDEMIIFCGYDEGDNKRKAAFKGWWLIHPGEQFEAVDTHAIWAVAVTRKGNIVAIADGSAGLDLPRFFIYPSFEEAEKAKIPEEVISVAIKEYKKVFVETLDV
ncbi:MAG: hypothetical protein AB1796_11830 [Bacillota bacterium]